MVESVSVGRQNRRTTGARIDWTEHTKKQRETYRVFSTCSCHLLQSPPQQHSVDSCRPTLGTVAGPAADNLHSPHFCLLI
ncbi:hypothetical protein GHT06_017941 [Daphnia sinensis]|uniref:Uncharacterized protein n=1 Tax=Daphnia sinensis TaxID=1820382 RepID=A0AAD5KLT8_9CRUS|nr:hypothetical protein GHT06_017941 [Daphnia sinensis]